MANRSYIYAIKNNKHISLGECPSYIPYAFRILAAYDNAVEDSHLFDKIVGIKANFAKGKTALYYFLDFLIATGQMTDAAGFESSVNETKTFLDKIDADEILLENGEIYALYTDKEGNYLDGPGLEKTNEWAREDYQWIGEDIDNLQNFQVRPSQLFGLTDEKLVDLFKWMMGLKDNWKETLGLDAWRSVLYFQFNESLEP
ncbi:MAG: hypothetical protein QM737_01145 [Ferruginibacter sp.]